MASQFAEAERARAAAARGAWVEAHDGYAALPLETLGAEDLEAFAESAWWRARLDQSMALRERAYAAFAQAGDGRRAGYAAWFLAYDHFSKADEAAGNGWLARAKRHLDGLTECAETLYLAYARSDVALWRGEPDLAYAEASRVVDAAQRLGLADVVAMGIQGMGRALIAQGKVHDGLTLLDEVMVSVVRRELSPLITGWIYCNALSACMELGELRRAGAWAEAAQRWCEGIGVASPYHGLCRIYHAEVRGLAGEWEQAGADAERAAEELAIFGPHLAGAALSVRGEILRRMGDLAGAEEAFLRVHALGRDPHPGLALVRLAQGDAGAALAAIRVPLATPGGTPTARSRLLAAKVEIALAAGDAAAARDAAHELDALAAATGSVLLEATAAAARAAVRLDASEIEPTLAAATRARELWQTLRMPYEEARARMAIGVACLRAGDRERARLELQAARDAFAALGATLLEREAADLLSPTAERPGGLSDREVEVLRLVAAGKTNRQIATAMTISEHTVSRHLQNIFTKLGVSSRAAATAFAVERGLVRASDGW